MADPLENKGDPAENSEQWFHDSFYNNDADIDESLWNKKVPYQLAIVVAEPQANEEVSYYVPNTTFIFTLPWIEDLSIHTPFAISTTATLGGIVEQHNAAPFRNIALSGSTGIMLKKETGKGIENHWYNSIAGGTISAISNTISSAKSVWPGKDTVGGEEDASYYSDTDANGYYHRTGYWQFHALRKFLEMYVGLKKTGGEEYSKWRLAFISNKDKVAYLVTPITFEMRRSAQSPMEYRYNIQFRAWKRFPSTKIVLTSAASSPAFSPADPSVIKNILNGLSNARRTILNAQKVFGAVYNDFDKNIMGPINEVVVGLKDLMHLTKTALDFPGNLEAHVKQQIHQIPNLRDSWNDMAKSWDRIMGDNIKYPGKTTAQAKGKLSIPPGVMDGISINQLNLPASAKAAIDQATEKARGLTRTDYDTYRNQFMERAADFADRVGLGDDSYNALVGRTAAPKLREATEQDVVALSGLSEAAAQFARLAAYEKAPPVTLPEYVGGLASEAGLSFRVPNSKFAVPFPYGATLERLAAQYLKDASRWMEIAALNELRAPYVDEEGFDLPLIGKGQKNQVFVASTENLILGQAVYLTSKTTSEKRHITGLTRISDNYWTITLDGAQDLAKWDGQQGATLHAYLPGTVNSQQIIYIPSDKVVPEEIRTKFVPGVDDLDGLLETGGIDLLLTPDGDLAVTPDGDCRVAYGLTNIIQRLKVGLATPKGSMILHPEFGLDIQVGESNADYSAQSLLDSAKSLVESDPAFDKVEAAKVERNGPVTALSMNVSLQGVETILPLTFDLIR